MWKNHPCMIFGEHLRLSMLRNGTDIFTLAKLMGHEGISVLQRYLKQTNLDTEEAHRRACPTIMEVVKMGNKSAPDDQAAEDSSVRL